MGSEIIHDDEKSHRKLIAELGLTSTPYRSTALKGIPDKDNPLYPVNRRCALLKKFLNTHSGFDRNDLQNYLNLFAFMMNPPMDDFERVEFLLSRALETPNLLK